MNEITEIKKVICLKWGSKYSSKDVNRLYHMVKKNLTLDYEFYCITEDPINLEKEIKALPLLDDSLQGWWHKLTLFQQDFYGLKGTALFLDLDIIITGKIDSLFDYLPNQTIAAKDFGKCKWGHLNSSVFRFEIGSLNYIWQGFTRNKDWIIENMNGDQDWIGRAAPGIKLFPLDWIASYKKHCQSEASNFLGIEHKLIKKGWITTKGKSIVPKGAKIVLFHGKPDPEDVAYSPFGRWRKAPWILDYWN